MSDPQQQGPPEGAGGSGNDSVSRTTARRLKKSVAAPGAVAPSQSSAGSGGYTGRDEVAGSRAPKGPSGGADPQDLAGRFQQAKDAGDIARAKNYGRWLQSVFNWEYGEGPGGWPYIKAHPTSIVQREPEPVTRRLFPGELQDAGKLADRFDIAKGRGDFLAMKSIGQALKDSYGYEYGIGDGGWPYMKPLSSDVIPIDDSPGFRLRKEVVARQMAQDRADREEREAAAHDTRGAIRRGGEGFFDALKAKLGDIEAGVGRGLQNVEDFTGYYRPEEVAARLLKRTGPAPAPSISAREANWGEQLKDRGENIAAGARHHQAVYGQDLASQTGAFLGDAAVDTGVGMLGGPYAMGALDATAAYGRGEPLERALGTGLISTGSLEMGGALGDAFAERAAASRLTKYLGEPVTRYLGRSAGYAAAPEMVSIPGTAVVYGKPQMPDPRKIALDIAQALGFGFLPGRRDAVKRIAADPNTHPDVRAALLDIAAGRIEPKGPPESPVNTGLSPGVGIDSTGGMQPGVRQSEVEPGPGASELHPSPRSTAEVAGHIGGGQSGREYLGPYYEELVRLRATHSEVLPDPDRTAFRVVKGDGLALARREFNSSGLRGHHVHPLAHGGPAIPEPGGLD